MYYYFDESGRVLKDNIFILGGLLIKDKSEIDWLAQALLCFRNKYKKTIQSLNNFHGSEMTLEMMAHLSQEVIIPLLKRDNQSCIRVYSRSSLINSTKDSSEVVYLELASDLISNLILMDSKAEIFYDNYFHFSHPANIMEKIKLNEPIKGYLKNYFNKFELKDGCFDAELRALNQKLSKINDCESLEDIVTKWQEVMNHSESKEEKLSYLTLYLQQELQQKIYGEENIKKVFNSKITTKIKSICERFNLHYKLPEIAVEFLRKDIQPEGVEIIDIICNSVYKHKKNMNLPTDLMNLFDYLTIEEF